MKLKALAILIGVLAAGSAHAQADRAFNAMGRDAGIRAREARMLTGAPTSYAEYRTSYWSARDKVRRGAYKDRYAPVRTERRGVPRAAPATQQADEPVAESYPLDER